MKIKIPENNVHKMMIVYPIPMDNFSWASSPIPDAIMIAQSGTAPRTGKTIPPNRKENNIKLINKGRFFCNKYFKVPTYYPR